MSSSLAVRRTGNYSIRTSDGIILHTPRRFQFKALRVPARKFAQSKLCTNTAVTIAFAKVTGEFTSTGFQR